MSCFTAFRKPPTISSAKMFRELLFVICLINSVYCSDYLRWLERSKENQAAVGRVLNVPEAFWLRERFLNTILTASLSNNTDDFDFTTNQCALDLDYVVESIQQPWAMKMLDASAKIESGVLYEQLYWTGNYDECLNVSAPAGQNTTGFNGQYCFLVLNPMGALPIQSAICIPDSCNGTQVQQYFSQFITYLEKFPFIKKIVEALNLQGIICIPSSANWDTSAIVLISFLACLASVVVIATLYDLYVQWKVSQYGNDLSCNASIPDEADFSDVDLHDRSAPLISVPSHEPKYLVLLCFSAFKNGSKLMDTKERENQLNCLHGLRFLSMSWIILGHTYSSGFLQMANISLFFDEMNKFSFLTVLQGSFAVDSFFFLSGFLLAYLFLKDGHVHMGIRRWAYFYFHRYLRLTPTYALVIGIWASVWLYVGSGPFWQFGGVQDQLNCQKNWWQNLLYINNFPNASNGCMGWSWYLANDMQFFVISPVFLYPLMRWPIVGIVITCCLLLASWIATGVISYQNNLIYWGSDLSNLTSAMAQELNYMDLLYLKPYTRIGPYLIGVLVAVCFLYLRKKRIFSKWRMAVGWTISTAMTLATMYGIYHSNMGVLTTAVYNALSRSAFALGLGWLTLACLTGYGGPVNWILSWKQWIPLSRLTYCAYLLHPMLITWYYQSLKHTFYFTHPTMVLIFLGMLVVSYAAAFVATIVIESPVVSVEKHFRNKYQ